jgi:hypothetical protein
LKKKKLDWETGPEGEVSKRGKVEVSFGMPPILDAITGMPVHKAMKYAMHPAMRERRILGKPQRMLEEYNPYLAGLIRKGTKGDSLVSVGGEIDYGASKTSSRRTFQVWSI